MSFSDRSAAYRPSTTPEPFGPRNRVHSPSATPAATGKKDMTSAAATARN
jgi:hypothetical protein